MVIEIIRPERKPLRLAYFDPQNGLRQFVQDGQGKRLHGLSGQALLRSVAERQSDRQGQEAVSLSERRRREKSEKAGVSYLDIEVTRPDGTKTTRKQRLLERVEAYSHHAIAQTYEGVTAQQAGDFYERRMLDANNFVKDYVELLFPPVRDIVGLNNDVRLVSADRTDILDVISQDPIDPHVFFEAQRHLVLANIAAELSERSRSQKLKQQVIQVQNELTTRLFKQPFGHTEYADTYAVYDTQTNTVLSVSDSLPSSVAEGQFVRHIQKRMRQVPMTEKRGEEEVVVGYQPALCEVRTKPRTSEMIKAIKKPVTRRSENKGDTIDVHEDVQDSMGLMFVVKGTMDSFEAPVTRMFDQVKKTITTRWPEATFVSDNDTNQDGTQSPHQKYQRYLVYLNNGSTPLPLEMIFYGEGDYLNSSDSVGVRREVEETQANSKTRRVVYEGSRAHEMYKIRQGTIILPIVMPPSVPFYNGRLNLQQTAYETMDKKAEEIKARTRAGAVQIEPGDES